MVKSLELLQHSGSKDVGQRRLTAAMLAAQKQGKPVHRWPLANAALPEEWEQSYRTVGQFMHYRKRIVVIIEPDDVIGMHLERSRTIYRAPIGKVFALLAQWHADSRK